MAMASDDIMKMFLDRADSGIYWLVKEEGFITGYEVMPSGAFRELVVQLKYYEGEPVIREISRVSKPGRRIYSKITDLQRVYNGLGIAILSTPHGVLSDNEARDQNVGGEILCQVF